MVTMRPVLCPFIKGLKMADADSNIKKVPIARHEYPCLVRELSTLEKEELKARIILSIGDPAS